MKQQGYTYKKNPPSIPLAGTAMEKVEVTNTEKYVIWHIQGGLGKNVAGTALIKSIKETYSDRKLIMVVSYPEIFLNNPLKYMVVYKVFDFYSLVMLELYNMLLKHPRHNNVHHLILYLYFLVWVPV